MASASETPAVAHRDTEWSVVLAAAAMVAFLVAAPLILYPVFLMKALCFALFACAFNLLVGYVGLLSFGHALYFGWAGYLCAYAAKDWGLPPEVAVLIGAATAAVLGLVAGAIAIRRQGIYFAMITLALAQMMYLVALRVKLTGGEDGIQDVPRGHLFGVFDLNNEMTMYAFVLVIVLAALFLIYRIINSPFGEVLKAIRENEQRAISLGYRTDRYKLVAFVLSATLAGAGRIAQSDRISARLADRRALDDVRRGGVDDAGRRARHHIRPGGRRLLHRGHGELPGAARPMGAGDPGRHFRRLRAAVSPRHCRRACPLAACAALTATNQFYLL